MTAKKRDQHRPAPEGTRDSEEQRMVLGGVDRDVFLEAVLTPPQPSPRLVRALRRHAGEKG